MSTSFLLRSNYLSVIIYMQFQSKFFVQERSLISSQTERFNIGGDVDGKFSVFISVEICSLTIWHICHKMKGDR